MIRVPIGELDVRACLSSGQIFRWSEPSPSRFVIPNGDAPIIADLAGQMWCLESTSDAVVEDFFQLHTNRGAIENHVMKICPGWSLEACGLRLLQPRDRFEVAMSFICSANNHLPRIRQMVLNLAGGDATSAFPKPCELCTIDEGHWRSKAFGYRAKSIHLASQLIHHRGGTRWLDELSAMTREQAHAELLSLPGFGRKVADCVALYGLHHLDAVPVDIHLWRAAERWISNLPPGKGLTARRYAAIGSWFRENFGLNAGWAQLLLFHRQQTMPRVRAKA